MVKISIRILIFSFILFFITSCTSSFNSIQYVEEEISFEKMQECTVDADCVYADNSCCPFTDSDNIVAINEAYEESYKEMAGKCSENIVCSEIYVRPVGNPKCVNNVCVVSS